MKKDKGKPYASRKPVEDRPEGDFYATAKSLVWVAKDIIKEEFDIEAPILEPCAGENAIVDELWKYGYYVTANDLYSENKDIIFGYDYLNQDVLNGHNQIITNFPFSQFDEFVMKAKTHCNKFMTIAKTNFFGAYKRHEKGVWKNLKHVYIFNRQVDYRSPMREDGMFKCGNLVTGWFLWDMSWDKDYWNTSILDVQNYVIRKDKK